MIRQITLDDFEPFFEIWKEGSLTTFSNKSLDVATEESFYKETYKKRIAEQDQNFKIWGYFEDAVLLGWVSILPCRPGPYVCRNYGEISLYVKDKYQERGIAKQMSVFALDHARTDTGIFYVTALISERNEPIKKLAQETGFSKIAVLPRSGKDTFIPECSLWMCAL